MTIKAPTRENERGRVPKLRFATGVAAVAILGALLFVPSFAPVLLRFEHWTADWRTALLADSAPTQNPSIGLVLINDDTLKDYASSPIDRSLLARIVEAIDRTGAKAIGIDVLFLKKSDPVKDDALLNAIAGAHANIILGVLDERGDLQPFQRDFQREYIDKIGRAAGYLNLHHDRDDVVRFTAGPQPENLPNSGYPKSFARLLAEAGDAPAPADDAGRPIPWLAKPKDANATFLTFQAQDLLNEPAKGTKLEDRLVLVGGDFPLRDRHRVPLSARDGLALPGVAIHAQILAAMLEPKRAIAELGPIAVRSVLLVVAIAGFATGWAFWQSSIIHSLGTGFATAVLLVLDAFCYKELRLLLPFTLVLVAWVAGLTAGRSWRFVLPDLARRRI